MKYKLLIIAGLFITLLSCNEDTQPQRLYAVSFALPSININTDTTQVTIKFSQPTNASGTLHLKLTDLQTTYGVHYQTMPESVNNDLFIDFEKGVNAVSFEFHRLLPPQDNQTQNVTFSIVANSINYTIMSNTSIVLNFNDTALIGNVLAPEVGGANQPNQVYVDLSTGQMTTVPRVSWDLGFYTGDDFRVILNSSVKMSAKSLATTDISLSAIADDTMLIGQGAGNASQVDAPSGNISQTAIAAITAEDSQNQVYLINLGSNPAQTQPSLGSVGADTGTHRGWKKIRILRASDNNYRLQYADLDQTNYQEVIIEKQPDYNFVFFSFTTQAQVMVEPQKQAWDLNFTTFTNTFAFGTSEIPYFYSDFILHNSRGGATAYSVSTDNYNYEAFSLSDVDYTLFATDQTTIGATWRSTSVTGPNGVPVSEFVVFTNLFYVIKDAQGNIYKLRMTQGVLENGERGHPKFVYQLL